MKGKKKGKTKSKKGKSKSKKKAAVGQPNDLIFPNILEDLTPPVPQVDLVIRLANPATDYLSFTMKVPVSSRVAIIKDRIIRQHQGAISNVKICFNEFKQGNEANLADKLVDIGIQAAGQYQVYYDYSAYSHPLLTYSTPIAALDF